MYSNKSDFDYGKRRPHNSRGSRARDKDDRREEWDEPSRKPIREAFDQYLEERHSRNERVSSDDYSDPHTKDYNSDTDWRRRGTPSYERSGSEKRWRALDDDDSNDDDDDQYRYQQGSYRQSSERFSHRSKDFKQTRSVEEGYSRKRSPEEFRYSKHQDEFGCSPYREDSHYRPTEYNRDSRERSRSPQRARSRDTFSKGYTPPQLRRDSFSRDHEDDYHDRTRFSLNGSSRLPATSHHRLSPPPPPPPSTAAPEKKMSKGFQRFLDVLNMGVNVETLTKIVTQGPPDMNVPPPSSRPHDDQPWTSAQRPRQNPQYWPQTERNQRPPPPHSYSSNGRTKSEEKPSESRNPERKFPSPTDDTPNFDDENKRQQVHDVLQAIGIKLEFEELGRMSTRIQERLYGKKSTDSAPPNRTEEDKQAPEKMKEAYIPKRCSESDSSSSFQNKKKSAWRDGPKYPYQKDSPHPQQNPNPNPPPAPMPSHPIPPPPPGPMFNCPPSAFSMFPQNMPPPLPNMPMPHLPPFSPPYIQTPPCLNMLPLVGSPSAPFPNAQAMSRRHPNLNLIMVPPSDFSNFEMSQNLKTMTRNNTKTGSNNSNNKKRHRYLHHVETKN